MRRKQCRDDTVSCVKIKQRLHRVCVVVRLCGNWKAVINLVFLYPFPWRWTIYSLSNGCHTTSSSAYLRVSAKTIAWNVWLYQELGISLCLSMQPLCGVKFIFPVANKMSDSRNVLDPMCSIVKSLGRMIVRHVLFFICLLNKAVSTYKRLVNYSTGLFLYDTDFIGTSLYPLSITRPKAFHADFSTAHHTSSQAYLYRAQWQHGNHTYPSLVPQHYTLYVIVFGVQCWDLQ